MAPVDSHRFSRPLLQLSVLAAIALGFAVGPRTHLARAGGGDCPDADACTFKRPNVMFVVEYSTQLNAPWDEDLTRWEAAVSAVQNVTQPGSYLSQQTHLALMRYGHDPDPDAPGTAIDGDASGLIDGHVLDVAWDDDALAYLPCNGQAVIDALADLDAPLGGAEQGIEPWTRGALEAAAAEVAQTRADHPEDLDERIYLQIVVGSGRWTNADGQQDYAPGAQDPALVAGPAFDQDALRTYVLALGPDPDAAAAADDLASAGGTTQALQAESTDEVLPLATTLNDAIIDDAVAPACVGGLARVMVLLDASSSMLNTDGGAIPAPMGESSWDAARRALAGQQNIFELDVGPAALADLAHIGLATWGSPGEEKVLVQYGPCVRENMQWALDPTTSCVEPGCEDPWGGPPINWSFQDGNEDPPGFSVPTQSHMPDCGGFEGQHCSGSGTATHLGLAMVRQNQEQYQAAGLQPQAMYPTAPDTHYLNIVISDGSYMGYSTDAQVQGELEAMFEAGITTRVLGYGDLVESPQIAEKLELMAGWGSGDAFEALITNNQAELEQELAGILQTVPFDPCCAFVDCYTPPQPTGLTDPDPVPNTDSNSMGDGDGDTSGAGDGDGDGDGDTSGAGDGDGDPAGDGDGDTSTSDGSGSGSGSGSGDGDGDSGDGDSGESSESGVASEESGSEGGDPPADGDGGCACSSSSPSAPKGPAGLLVTGLLLLGIRRRRPARASR